MLINIKSKKLGYVLEGQLGGVEKTEEQQENDNNEVLKLFFNSLSENVSQKVLSCTKAKDVWSRLHQVYENRSPAMVGKMYERYYSYRKEGSDDMGAHIAKAEALAIALGNVREKESEILIMSRLLHSLPTAYSPLITAWDSVQPSLQTREELISRLLNDIREGQVSKPGESSVFIAGAKSRQLNHE